MKIKSLKGVVLCASAGLLISAAAAQPERGTAPAGQPQDQRSARDGERRPDAGQPGGPNARRPGGGGEITNVESAMKLINRSARRLKQQIADPEKKEENLKIVGDIEKAIVAAKSMPAPEARERRGGPGGHEQPGGSIREGANDAQPERGSPPAAPVAGRPGDDAKPGDRKPGGPPADPKRTETYRRDLLKLLQQVLTVEQDLMDGKTDAAKEDFDKIVALRDAAHKELGIMDERDDR